MRKIGVFCMLHAFPVQVPFLLVQNHLLKFDLKPIYYCNTIHMKSLAIENTITLPL